MYKTSPSSLRDATSPNRRGKHIWLPYQEPQPVLGAQRLRGSASIQCRACRDEYIRLDPQPGFSVFLPVNKKQKRERLAELQGEKRTVIFYEAPHKLRTTLDDLTAAFGPERSITLCRELTKLHEEIWKTTLGEAQTHYSENDPRGEYVLVMAGAPAAEAEEELTLEQAAQRALELTRNGYAASADAKAAAQGTPYSKSEVYKQLLALQAD